MERALTKIDQYNTTNNPAGGVGKPKKNGALGNLDPLPQLDNLSKFL